MKNLIALFFLILISSASALSQESGKSDSTGGEFQLGLRSTASLFSENGIPGTGVGGQFRIRLLERLNTEWFADYITSDLSGVGKRIDGHIGWAVMFYPFNTLDRKFNPYLLGGHCFDYTRIKILKPPAFAELPQPDYVERWSSAVHFGLGSHYQLTDFFDLSLSGQYMAHLGTSLHSEILDTEGGKALEVHREPRSAGLEGHLLITMSINVKVADLW